MKTKEIILENPYGNGFPVSYSIIYQNRLVSLFESGQFVCHSIPSMQRDLLFEKKINTKKFDYHWVIGDKLVGISQEKYFYLNSKDKWVNYRESIPLKNQPKLFEDSLYISFNYCSGEFGGVVYFYNKLTKKIFYTGATCSNTVYKKGGKYYVLSELGHEFGSTYLIEIPNPDQLTMTDIEAIHKNLRSTTAYLDKSNVPKNVFSFSEIGFHSTFNYKGRNVYLVYLPRLNRTFLAEVENNTIKVINPLFNSCNLIVHNPVTTLYPNTILINGSYWRIGRDREVSCVLIRDDEFIMIDWNEKYR